jgi:hypothetical protein
MRLYQSCGTTNATRYALAELRAGLGFRPACSSLQCGAALSPNQLPCLRPSSPVCSLVSVKAGPGRVPLPGNAEAGERGGSGGSPIGPSRHCYPPQEIALPPLPGCYMSKRAPIPSWRF